MNQAFLDLPSLKNAPIRDRRVLVRLDLDLPRSEGKFEVFRLKSALPTLEKVISLAREVTLIGHLGRPEGRDLKLSLEPIAEELGRLLKKPITFVENFVKSPSVKSGQSGEKLPNLRLLENLRFWPGEADADDEFAKILAGFGDFYVNESFASAHRSSASVTSLPRLLPTCFGEQFLKEVQAVGKVLESPNRPIVVVLGGAKPDKLEFLADLLQLADRVLLGGNLPKFLTVPHPRLIQGELDPSGFDLTPASAQKFAESIAEAGTVVWNGPVGKFEDETHFAGTKIVAEAVASTHAYTLVGGGDTQAALAKLKLEDKVKHLSTGGGAMLQLLAKGSLPALEAVH